MFSINPNSGAPIYKQLTEQVELLINARRLRPGDALPSVREIATTLAVNPMTVSKAFSLLEAQGLLVRQRGKPMRVAELATSENHSPLELLHNDIDELLAKAKQLDVTNEQLIDSIHSRLRNQDD